MITDVSGNTISSQDTVTVFDASLNYDSELFEDILGAKLREFDRTRYAAAYEVNFGAGADWPMVAYEVVGLIPYSAVAAAFFMGERIEKSMLAWKRIALALLSRIPRNGFTDANGAGLLALQHVFEHSENNEVQLVAYTWIDENAMFFDAPDKAAAAFDVIKKLDEIQPREQQFSVGLLFTAPTFLFKFEVDEKLILVAVKGSEVKLSEV